MLVIRGFTLMENGEKCFVILLCIPFYMRCTKTENKIWIKKSHEKLFQPPKVSRISWGPTKDNIT